MSRFNRPKEVIHESVDQELLIDDQRLNEELMDQPLMFRKWTRLLSEVSKKAKVIRLTLEEKEAECYAKYSADGTGKRVKEVESAVIQDTDVKRLKRELVDAETMVEEFTGIVKAFHQRYEMLKDLCANRRKELVD